MGPWHATAICPNIQNVFSFDSLYSCLRRSTKHSKPDVSIVRCKHTGYWLVNISCKDRNKLLFDTVSFHQLLLQIVLPAEMQQEHPSPTLLCMCPQVCSWASGLSSNIQRQP